jgi:hypothetical protein
LPPFLEDAIRHIRCATACRRLGFVPCTSILSVGIEDDPTAAPSSSFGLEKEKYENFA